MWQRSMKLVNVVFNICNDIHDKYLSSQVKRSMISVPSNIAEGCGRDSERELSRFLKISVGSLCELETQILISKEQQPSINIQDILQEIEELRRMIFKLIQKLKN